MKVGASGDTRDLVTGIGLGSTAGGDLGGTLPDPTVTGVGGIPIDDLPPTATGDVIVFNVTTGQWEVRRLDAADVDYDPTASGLTATDVQAAIDELLVLVAALGGDFLEKINGGGGTVNPLGDITGTAEIDLALGNYATARLTGDTDITLTTVAGVAERWFTFKVAENGTGGHTPTFVGSGTVVRIDGSPPHDTTPGTTTFYAGWSDNGGTTWYVFMLGGGSALTIEDDGTPLATAATTLDFVGAGVTASGAGAEKTITIPGYTLTEAAVRDIGRWEYVFMDGEIVLDGDDGLMMWVGG